VRAQTWCVSQPGLAPGLSDSVTVNIIAISPVGAPGPRQTTSPSLRAAPPVLEIAEIAGFHIRPGLDLSRTRPAKAWNASCLRGYDPRSALHSSGLHPAHRHDTPIFAWNHKDRPPATSASQRPRRQVPLPAYPPLRLDVIRCPLLLLLTPCTTSTMPFTYRTSAKLVSILAADAAAGASSSRDPAHADDSPSSRPSSARRASFSGMGHAHGSPTSSLTGPLGQTHIITMPSVNRGLRCAPRHPRPASSPSHCRSRSSSSGTPRHTLTLMPPRRTRLAHRAPRPRRAALRHRRRARRCRAPQTTASMR
jgi:hypothetical protein